MNRRKIREAAERYREHILPPYDAIMEMSGFDTICELTRNFGGSAVYIPSMRTIFSQCIDQDILRCYDGTNMRQMVQQYGFTERYIRALLRNAL